MATTKPDAHAVRDPEGQLERAFIDEFLRAHGHDPRAIDALPEHERKTLLREASVYAAGKLTEVEARAHFVRELHGQS